ncbi:glycerophosphodiester phosphodiesterase [Microbacterium sp. USHLN186]|uniref:glycerophosphodiester phosphodiesterase n=1 Tax=Microbacterium sp. USHLN186 TaxID=3081286 RepID=UPI00301AECAD
MPGSVSGLLGSESFFVAHRGSGDNWPEHTLTAYRSALKAGADAVEVSVCATADGVLVCHHDLSASRTLGVQRNISEMTWNEINQLRVDARAWLGPEAPLEPVSRLEDVFAALGDEVLMFIEDKQGSNTRAILDLMDAQPRSTERLVWKQWAPAKQVNMVKDRGYAAWGYFDSDQMGRLDEFAARFDAIGVPTRISDDELSRAVATGTPVICWEVHFNAEVDRLNRMGVAGKMCSNIPYLTGGKRRSSDDFQSGRRAAGDLPSGFEQLGWYAQPALVSDRGALRVQRAGRCSYLMGSLARPDLSLVSLEVTLTWPDKAPDVGAAGVVFGLLADGPGGEAERGNSDGYELHLTADGALRLIARESGQVGQVLAEQGGAAPRAGEQIRVRIDADASQVRIHRAGALTSMDVNDGRWRGPWVRLFKDYESPLAVEFSDITVKLL